MVAPKLSAEVISPEQSKAILKLAQDGKTAYLAKDYETFVGFLHPDVIKSAGGKEKLIQMMKSEDEKNTAAGVVAESFDFSPTDSVYTGSQFTVRLLQIDGRGNGESM